jgi:hypothetical protein
MDDHTKSRISDRLADQHGNERCAVTRALRAAARVHGARADRGGGPAQVASDAYRDGYDTIFGKARVAEA